MRAECTPCAADSLHKQNSALENSSCQFIQELHVTPAFPTNRFVTEREAAEYLGLSVKTIQAWRAKGEGPRFAKFGRAVRYQLNELNRWAECQQHASTASVSTGGAA